MGNLHLCPQCGAELPTAAPEGLCPRCLMQAGLESKTGEPAGTSAPTASLSAKGFVPPGVAELGKLFPQLEILELLGKGGMGAVYKARQPGLDRFVAVKILPPEVGADPAFAERFAREARALARLNHPNIVAVYDFGRTSPTSQGSEGLYWFVMEYVEGVNLRQAIRGGQLKHAEALKIVPQICDALQFAHEEGIVHRDIKPVYILLDKKGRIKIADFGLAKLTGKETGSITLTGTQQSMGTLHYMAPEQFEGAREVDHRADIYSLGVTFYEMLTGELPIGRFAPPSHKVQVDVRLDEVVLRSLEKEPGRRYQHASDVKTEVEAIARLNPVGSAVDPVEKAVLELLPDHKFDAIKKYRDLKGATLAEAVKAVEEIARKHGIVLPPAALFGKVFALVVIVGILGFWVWGLLNLDISPLLTTPLIFIALLGPKTWEAWRYWGTSRGRQAAWFAGLWAFCLFGGPVLEFLTRPEATLEWLSTVTGVRVGQHDADVIRGIFVVLILIALFYLIVFWIGLRREARAARSDSSKSLEPEFLSPQNLQRGVKLILWCILLGGAAVALFVSLRATQEGEGNRLAIEVGAFEPWVTFERLELKEGGFRTARHLYFFHWSFWAGVAGVLAAYGLYRLRSPSWSWGQWWLDLNLGLRRIIKLALVALCLFGIIWFLTFQAQGSRLPNGARHEISVGAFDPWFVHHNAPSSFSTTFHIFSLSALLGYMAILFLWLLIVMERLEKRQPVGVFPKDITEPAKV